MFGALSQWIVQRLQRARLCREDARELLNRNPATAYYDAQRAAARARFAGDGQSFIHWARVSAEIARISQCPMDMSVVRAIVDEEEQRAAN